MKQQTIGGITASSLTFEGLEPHFRGKIREWMQALLVEEVTEFLGRGKSERNPVPERKGYRNGYGKERHLTTTMGTVALRRPRVRGLEERFISRLLPLFVRRTREVRDLLPALYLYGLSEGDFELALRGLLGEEAPLSAKTVARLKERWQAEYEEWRTRDLSDLTPVYLWADGVYVKAGLEKEKAALLVVMAALSDGKKVIVSVVPGHRESTESWSGVLRDMKSRGLRCPRLIVGDGHLGIWGAARNVYPEAEEQRCWNHRIINLLDKIPKKSHSHGKMLLRQIPYAPTAEEAAKAKGKFQSWCRQKGFEEASALIEVDWDRMVTFYRFPQDHWQHLRTTNPVESPFAALRLRTEAAKRYKKVNNASALIWKMLLVAESRFRSLKAPELMKDVWNGERYKNGVKVNNVADGVAA